MKDAWLEHVVMELNEAYQDPDRLVEIVECVHQMFMRDLIPDDVSTALFRYIDNMKGY